MLGYLRSHHFKRYTIDWVIGVALLVYFFAIAEHAKPFNRQFKLSDFTIQHPFAVKERVTGIECILLATFVPLITISAVIFVSHRLSSSVSDSKRLSSFQQLHLLQVSVLGLLISLATNGVVTDILKNWIARPRPDFLERCGAPLSTDPNVFLDISVCTAPLGVAILTDGMRSTPSGHSSISFSGLLYLTLWLLGQFKLINGHQSHPVYKYILSGLPIILALYVALSRVQDYRHHFSDIILGGIIGTFFAIVTYRKYFHSLFGEHSHKVAHDEEDTSDSILPIYTTVNQH